MKMVPNTYTQRGVLGGDSRPGPTPVSPLESGLGGKLAMCVSSEAARGGRRFTIRVLACGIAADKGAVRKAYNKIVSLCHIVPD